MWLPKLTNSKVDVDDWLFLHKGQFIQASWGQIGHKTYNREWFWYLMLEKGYGYVQMNFLLKFWTGIPDLYYGLDTWRYMYEKMPSPWPDFKATKLREYRKYYKGHILPHGRLQPPDFNAYHGKFKSQARKFRQRKKAGHPDTYNLDTYTF